MCDRSDGSGRGRRRRGLEDSPFVWTSSVEVDVDSSTEEATVLRSGDGGFGGDEGFGDFLLWE